MDVFWPVVGVVLVLSVGVVSPGPSFVFIAQRAVARSRQDGLAASVGMGLGGVLFAILALAGIHTVFLLFPLGYTILKLVGGAYLLWMGWKIWKGSKEPLDLGDAGSGAGSAGKSFILGLVTQLSNPKTAIVYGSIFAGLLPAHLTWEFVAWLLPAVFVVETGWYSFVALILSSSGPRRLYLRSKRLVDRGAAGILGVLGVKLLWESRA